VVSAGDGGNGSARFVRTQYGNRIPMGGNGGDGGDVVLQASEKVQNLQFIKKSHYKGNNGKAGMNKNCAGKNGGTKNMNVPIGTLVYELPDLSKLKNETENQDIEFGVKYFYFFFQK